MASAEFDSVLYAYEAALMRLEEAKSKATPKEVLTVLISRDALQENMQGLTVPVVSDQLLKIVELDNQLKHHAALINSTINLSSSRASLDPPQTAWWWFLETPPHFLNQLDWFWSLLSVASLTGSFSIALFISSCFLAGGADIFGTLAVSAQAILTFLQAQGRFSKEGKKTLQHFLKRINIPEYWWREVELGLSLILLSSLLLFSSILPSIGEEYLRFGIKHFHAGHLSRAEGDFQRALHLNPDDVETNFYLGLLYEDLQQLNKAKEQYRIAVLGQYAAAFNNLARLYILDEQYSMASSLLQRLRMQGIDPNDVELTYAFYKNLGWLELGLNQLVSAKSNLQLAIDSDPAQPAAQCLMAQVLDKQQMPQEALPFWNNCLAHASGLFPEEAYWIGLARERLQ